MIFCSGVASVTFPIHVLSIWRGVNVSSTAVGSSLIYARVLTTSSGGVVGPASLPEYFEMLTFCTSIGETSSDWISHVANIGVKNCLNVFPLTHPPYPFTCIGLPWVLPARNTATFDGVYPTSHPSLGRLPLPLGFFISVVPDLFA